jgi:ketosteroid isomerase-like protein
MPEAVAQIVRRVADLMWIDRDLDAAMELVDPEAVFDWSDSRAPYGGVFRGRDAIRDAAEALWDAWDEWDPEFREVIDIDPDTVLIMTFVRARGKGSGIPVEAHGASLWSVRDGKVIHAKLFQSKADAIDAIRLQQASDLG